MHSQNFNDLWCKLKTLYFLFKKMIPVELFKILCMGALSACVPVLQKRASDGCDSRWLCTILVLGIELRTSEKAASALHLWAFFPSHILYFYVRSEFHLLRLVIFFIIQGEGNFHFISISYKEWRVFKGMNNCNIFLFECVYIFNFPFSLPIKDSSAEYSNENFSCTLYCGRDHIFLYKLLPCNLHRWCWQKWINHSSEYTLRFSEIRKLRLVLLLWFSFEWHIIICQLGNSFKPLK